MKLHYFKNAVAFYFLFFLHETSIRNGQQGISYNVLRLCVCLPFAQSFNFTTNVDGANSTKPLL